jgi:predicted ATP-grasp superfamily ATP-dependent carboligase
VDVAINFANSTPRIIQWFSSRYVQRRIVVPHPREHPERLKDSILALCRDGRYDAVLPTTEESTLILSEMKSDLEPYVSTPLVHAKKMALAHDKAMLNHTLHAAGFSVPRPYEYRDLRELAEMKINFPVVVKARKNSGVQRGMRHAKDHATLLAAVQEIESQPSPHPNIADYSRPLIQEFIPGTVHDADCLYMNGEPRAAMTNHRKVMYPSGGGGGVTTVATYEPELLAYAESILRHLKWHGLCNVEVIKDTRDGKYKLLEINPRIRGLIDFNVKAGIDFPTKACEIAAYGDTEPKFDYCVGMQYTMLFPRAILALVDSKGSRWSRIKEILQIFGRKGRCEVDLCDPMPHVFDILSTIQSLTKNAVNRFRHSARNGQSKKGQTQIVNIP